MTMQPGDTTPPGCLPCRGGEEGEDLPAVVVRCSLVHLTAREILVATTGARLGKLDMGATGLVVRIAPSYASSLSGPGAWFLKNV